MTEITDGKNAYSRRQLLAHGIGAGLALLLPPLAGNALPGGMWTAIGKPGDFKLRQPKRVVLAGGGVIYVTRLTSTKLMAVSARCPHQGCEVRPAASGHEYVCPCHGATFTPAGKNLRGPAKAPLPSIPVIQKGAQVLVSAQAAKSRASMPAKRDSDHDQDHERRERDEEGREHDRHEHDDD